MLEHAKSTSTQVLDPMEHPVMLSCSSSRAVTPGGTLARDGRVQPGDYLVSVNEEEMRTISHSQALDILRRTHMVPLGQGRLSPISAMNARFKVARWQNLIPSVPWIAPGWRE